MVRVSSAVGRLPSTHAYYAVTVGVDDVPADEWRRLGDGVIPPGTPHLLFAARGSDDLLREIRDKGTIDGMEVAREPGVGDLVECLYTAIALWDSRGRQAPHLVVALPTPGAAAAPSDQVVAALVSVLDGFVATAPGVTVHLLCPRQHLRVFRADGAEARRVLLSSRLRRRARRLERVAVYDLHRKKVASIANHLWGAPRRFGSKGMTLRLPPGFTPLAAVGCRLPAAPLAPLEQDQSPAAAPVCMFVPWDENGAHQRRSTTRQIAMLVASPDDTAPVIEYSAHRYWSPPLYYTAVAHSLSLTTKIGMCAPRETAVPDLLFRVAWCLDARNAAAAGDYLRYLGDTVVNIAAYHPDWSVALDAAATSSDATLQCLSALHRQALTAVTRAFVRRLPYAGPGEGQGQDEVD